MYKLLSKGTVKLNIIRWSSTSIQIQRNFKQNEKNAGKESKAVILKRNNITLDKMCALGIKYYRIYRNATKDLYTDLKKYRKIKVKQNLHGLSSLTREDLQFSHRLSKDIIKIPPICLLVLIPFGNFIIFLLAYIYPKYLLPSYYWSEQTKLQITRSDYKERLKHSQPLLTCMQEQVENIKDHALKVKWNGIIACLGSGAHPTIRDIISCSDLFKDSPYSLNTLKRKHVIELLGIHGLSPWILFKRQSLMKRAMFIKEMDRAIQREGGVTKMSSDSLKWALLFRGANPENMSDQRMRIWLETWLNLSQHVEMDTMSLLLHGPILLAYNWRTNWLFMSSEV